MKKIQIIVFFALALITILDLRGQNCGLIRQKIKSAIGSRSLGDALVQVKALRACDNSALGKQEADNWTEQIFIILKERQAHAKEAELRAKKEADIALNNAQIAGKARQQAEIERNNAIALEQLTSEKIKERNLVEEERLLAINKKAYLIRVADLQLLGRIKYELSQYEESIRYFQEALAVLCRGNFRSDTFIQDSIDVQNHIVLVSKIALMEKAIQRLHNNADSIIKFGASNFSGAFRALDTAIAHKINITSTGMSFQPDSLRFIRALENFEFKCAQQARFLKTNPHLNQLKKAKKHDWIDQYLTLIFASAEASTYINKISSSSRMLKDSWAYEYSLDKYSENMSIQNYIKNANKHKWAIGFGLNIRIQDFGELERGIILQLDDASKETNYLNRDGGLIFVNYNINKKTTIEVRYNRLYFTGSFNFPNNLGEPEVSGSSTLDGKDYSLILHRQIISIQKPRSSFAFLSLQFSFGITASQSMEEVKIKFNNVIDPVKEQEYIYSKNDWYFEEQYEIFLLQEFKLRPYDNNNSEALIQGDLTQIDINEKTKLRTYFLTGLKLNIFPFRNKKAFFISNIYFYQPLNKNEFWNPIQEMLNFLPKNLKGPYISTLKYKKIEIKEVNNLGLNLSIGLAFRL